MGLLGAFAGTAAQSTAAFVMGATELLTFATVTALAHRFASEYTALDASLATTALGMARAAASSREGALFARVPILIQGRITGCWRRVSNTLGPESLVLANHTLDLARSEATVLSVTVARNVVHL